MILFDKARDNAAVLRSVGRYAVERAKLVGVPAHYLDPSQADAMVREHPDGRRETLGTSGDKSRD